MSSGSAAAPLSRRTLPSYVLTNAVTVGTLYLVQALVPAWTQDFGPVVPVRIMPGATLAGYAIGVALSAALVRDLTSARGFAGHLCLLSASLYLAAWAPTPGLGALACLLIGLGCSLTQRLLALSTQAVDPAVRGRAIGWVIAGGLFGIVMARACVPLLIPAMGRQGVLVFVACMLALCGSAALWSRAAPTRIRIESVPPAWLLWAREPELRRAALQQAVVFAGYNLGWAVYPRSLLAQGVSSALPMGAVASLGAVAAVFAGRLCGRLSPADIAWSGFLAILVAMVLSSVSGPAHHARDAEMAVIDIGTQIALVANQARAQALGTSPAMRGRIAAIVTTAGFLGGALGAGIGNLWL